MCSGLMEALFVLKTSIISLRYEYDALLLSWIPDPRGRYLYFWFDTLALGVSVFGGEVSMTYKVTYGRPGSVVTTRRYTTKSKP